MKKLSPTRTTALIAAVIAYMIVSLIIFRVIAPALVSMSSDGAVVIGFSVMILWVLLTCWIVLTILARMKRRNRKATHKEQRQ